MSTISPQDSGTEGIAAAASSHSNSRGADALNVQHRELEKSYAVMKSEWTRRIPNPGRSDRLHSPYGCHCCIAKKTRAQMNSNYTSPKQCGKRSRDATGQFTNRTEKKTRAPTPAKPKPGDRIIPIDVKVPAILGKASVTQCNVFQSVSNGIKKYIDDLREKNPGIHHATRRLIPLRTDRMDTLPPELGNLEADLKMITDHALKSMAGRDTTRSLLLSCLDKKNILFLTEGTFAEIIVAPPASGVSNSHSKNRIHRDYHGLEHDVFMCMLFLDKTGPDNGIEFWPNSVGRLVDHDHPKQAIKDLESDVPVFESGELAIWHARTLHQSLANKTDRQRLSLSWYISETTVISNVEYDEDNLPVSEGEAEQESNHESTSSGEEAYNDSDSSGEDKEDSDYVDD